jgi:hypothetical protein
MFAICIKEAPTLLEDYLMSCDYLNVGKGPLPQENLGLFPSWVDESGGILWFLALPAYGIDTTAGFLCLHSVYIPLFLALGFRAMEASPGPM